MAPDTRQGKVIQSVQRAIDILNCFSQANTELTLGEISSMLELNKGTVHGIINTLRNNNYICQNRMGKYLLGPAIFAKRNYVHDTMMALFADVARQHMQELSNQYTTTGNLFSLDSGFPYLVHNTDPHNAIFLLHKARPEMPTHASASGKLALAYQTKEQQESILSELELTPLTASTITSPKRLRQELDDIRAQGYSYEREELAEGVSAISVPIFRGDALFGMLSMTGMSANIARNQQRLVADLKRAAADISKTVSGFSSGVDAAQGGRKG